MTEQISRRISAKLGSENLVERLQTLSGADLNSLMLAVLKRKLEHSSPASLLAPSAATLACSLDGRLIARLERLALDLAAQFEALRLSPVVPLGAVHTLTGLDQANVLSTIKALECASDPTVGMALECARRRKSADQRKQITRLCTSQRVLRFPLPQQKGYTAHFDIFSLLTGGRDTGSFSFELAALKEQLDFYLSFIAELNKADFCLEKVSLEISDTRAVAHLCQTAGIDRDKIRKEVRARNSASAAKLLSSYAVAWPKRVRHPSRDLLQFALPAHVLIQMDLVEEQIMAVLPQKFPELDFSFNMQRLTGLGYYDGPCFHIKACSRGGDEFMLADGGFVNWTRSLLTDSKERLLSSAIGIELLCRLFRQT